MPHRKVGLVPELAFSNSVLIFCGGACAVVLALTLLSFVSLLAARSSDAATERASALLVCGLCSAVSLGVLWTLTGGAPFLDAVFSSSSLGRVLPFPNLAPAIFQVQASLVALIVAFLAWRFPRR